MKRYKFEDLLTNENMIRDFYQEYGLSFNSSNRITKYFKHLGEIEKYRKLDNAQFKSFMARDRARNYYSQFYVLEISNIFEALQDSTQNPKVIKEKLTDLSKGTYLLSEESSNNTKARDSTFELSLFAFLKSKGMTVILGDPNPDIKLINKRFIYNIECKRPNSAKTLEKHLRKAVKQLSVAPSDGIPTIALSLEQIMLGGELILDSQDENSALAFLDRNIYQFHIMFEPLIRKICGNGSFLILYYLSCLTGFRTELPMANATYIIGNIYNFSDFKSEEIKKDLGGLISH